MTPNAHEANPTAPEPVAAEAAPQAHGAPETEQNNTLAESTPKINRTNGIQPVLEKLFALYPHLFGAQFLPLKLGIFQELLARHPEDFKRDTLKAALGMHTRSTRYLQSVAAGNLRHDLDGAAGEPVAPEHVYLSLLELFRRRQARSRDDLRPKFRAQLAAAFDASGLSRQDYLARVQTSDAEATRLLDEALAEHGEKAARLDALLRAYDTSGKSAEEFADVYGLNLKDVKASLAQRQRVAPLAAGA
ncbi:MAG: ProQ/FINO family protein [Polaromonas sp.]|nr:ProQ/FINO family protein [Polaromonas sp.]